LDEDVVRTGEWMVDAGQDGASEALNPPPASIDLAWNALASRDVSSVVMLGEAARLFVLAAALLLLGCAASNGPAEGSPPPPAAELRLRMPDGSERPLRHWTPDRPPRAVILALHGFNDHSLAFDQLGAVLAEAGLLTYAYDQRGFGAAPGRGWWPGTDALLSDLASAVSGLRREHPQLRLHCVGESMGAALLIVALEWRAVSCDSVVLAAPAIAGLQVMPSFIGALLRTADRLAPGLTLPLPAGVRPDASADPAVLEDLATDPLVIKTPRVDAVAGLAELMTEAMEALPRIEGEILWLYGLRDEIVPPEVMAGALERLPERSRARVALYPEGSHLLMRGEGAATAAADLVAWITDPAAPLPSGADRLEVMLRP
jgi:alpha-beta hydrolase superfamily lysophospholipase